MFLLLKLTALAQHSLIPFAGISNPAQLIESVEDTAVGNNDSKPTGSKSKGSKRKKRIFSVPLSTDSSNEEEIDLFPKTALASTVSICSSMRLNTRAT